MKDRLPQLAVSVAFHLLLYWLVGRIPEPPDDGPRLIEFEVAELPEPPKPKPKPKVEPPPKPDPPPEPEEKEPDPPPEKVEPQPKVKPRAKPPEPKTPPPPAPAAKPKFRLPPGQVVPGDGSGASTEVGESDPAGEPTGRDDGRADGRKGGTGTGPAGPPGPTSPQGKPGKPWKPTGDLYIRKLPEVAKQPPKLQCPATLDGLAGIVVLKVQIRRDGSIRSVRKSKGIGGGCDEIAEKAVKQAKFKPAIATDGNPADYELRYEYEFRAGG